MDIVVIRDFFKKHKSHPIVSIFFTVLLSVFVIKSSIEFEIPVEYAVLFLIVFIISNYIYYLIWFKGCLVKKILTFKNMSDEQVTSNLSKLIKYINTYYVLLLLRRNEYVRILLVYSQEHPSAIVRHWIYQTIGSIGGKFAYNELLKINESDPFANLGKEKAIEIIQGKH